MYEPITTYTLHREISPPSSSRLAVDGPADQIVRAPAPWLAPLLDLVQVVHTTYRHGHALPCLMESVIVVLLK